MHKLLSVCAAIALAGTAYAGGDKSKTTSSDIEQYGTDQGTGGSGEVGKGSEMGKSSEKSATPPTSGTTMTSDTLTANELSGEVVRVDANKVYLKHMGAVVPLKITSDTKWDGALTKKDLKEGKEIRASFKIEGKTDNVATLISLGGSSGSMQPGTGGSGINPDDQMDTPAEPERSPNPLPEDLGTEGSRPVY